MNFLSFPAGSRHSAVSGGLSANAGEQVNFIKASLLGAGMTDLEARNLASKAHPKTYLRRAPLFLQGETRHELFLVITGYVKLTQIGQGGSEVLLWACGPTSVLGILSEMNASPYSCSAHAVGPCTALVWNHDAIASVAAGDPRLRQNLSAVLLHRVTELEERFRELATENVSRRLACALLRLSKEIGRKGPRGVEIQLSREEMAQMTGTTLFTISRTLSLWAKEKKVLAGRESVVLPDLRLIETLAQES